MAKKYAGENALTYLITLVKTALNSKVNTADVVNDLVSDETNKPLSAAQGKVLAGMISDAGAGDMMKVTYDADNDGVVDNAKKLDGHAAEDFAPKGEAAAYVSSLKGQPSGLVPLDGDGKVSSEFLPSYVDDVVEGYFSDGAFYEDGAHTEEKKMAGEQGKIYVDLTSGGCYRYSGNVWVEIASSDMVEVDNATIQSIWESPQ